MISLKLIEVDPTPGGCGLPESRKTKAISSSYQALVDYCKETFNYDISSEKKRGMWDIRYEIEPTDVVIVADNHSKFDK